MSGAAAAAPAAGTFAASDAVELAVVERSGFVESRHVGSAVVLSSTGEVLSAHGDPSAPIIPRSCLKPFQALAVLRAIGDGSGIPLDAVQTVLATASHAGTAEHVAVVESILQLAGLAPDALQCPCDWPGSSAARDALVRDGLDRSPLYMNCSGKHAAMFYACVLNGWPVESYLAPEHPLQQRILATIEELTGETVAASAVDGCGAPVYAVSLTGLARGIGRITTALPLAPIIHPVGGPFVGGASVDGAGAGRASGAASVAADVFVDATHAQGATEPVASGAADDATPPARLVSAEAATLTASVLANGWAIDGPGRANTLCIDELAVFSKLGAEGVMVMSTTAASPSPGAADAAGQSDPRSTGDAEQIHHRDTAGTTVALKMLDGDLRAATLVGLTLLVRAGALTQDSVDALLPRLGLTVYGGAAPVGAIRLGAALA
ncbi:asparaginase [Subtercola sp. Z020]|uniref:asparaginase n=1 Tax=Subtercola sp. Z020 TaxID=2080582 RepID=UPI0011B06E4C|nr:asparaginase [Subtercola sp. Z020]